MISQEYRASPAACRPPLWPLQMAVVGFVLFTAVFHLTLARKGYADYRDQHLGAALEYAKGHIDLLNPHIVGFNANNTPTPLELPLWQATAAVLFKVFGDWFGWANVASLFFGVAALWPLHRLARAYAGERAAWWALLFFTAQPLVFFCSGRGGTDGSCLTITIWFLYFADRLLRTGQARWCLPAAVLGAGSAVTKAPFFFCAGLTSFFLLLLHGRRDWRRWLLLVGVGAVSAGVFVLWTRHSDAAIARAEFPLVDLRTSAGPDGGQFMRNWYFGDLHYRLNPANWIKGGWRFLNGEVGSFALAGALLWGLFGSRHRLGQLGFLAGAITTLVFTHLVLFHANYYLMFSPAVAMLCGWAAEKLELACPAEKPAASVLVVGVAAGVLLLGTIQGLIGMKIAIVADPYPRRIAEIIRHHTTPQDKLLIQGGGWGGEQLILSHRRGLSIWNTEFLEKPANLARLRKLGFTKLVMISESPMHLAIQQTNPGQAEQQRDSYKSKLTPVVKDWPTLLKTDDILIKAIPGATQ